MKNRKYVEQDRFPETLADIDISVENEIESLRVAL